MRQAVARLLGIRKWVVVSTYQDGTQILERDVIGWREAERAAERVREFRSDQDEGPVVEIRAFNQGQVSRGDD